MVGRVRAAEGAFFEPFVSLPSEHRRGKTQKKRSIGIAAGELRDVNGCKVIC